MAGLAVTRPAPVPLAPLLLAVAVALPLAVSMPLGLAVYGFMLLGVAHNLAELRYVFGRYVLGSQGLGRLERGGAPRHRPAAARGDRRAGGERDVVG
ncbi:MAG: hypothetical protein IPK67_19495, partial [Planctomycetes bacterium]|nr:hypothetical protein [Planctomycetota bacterium]